MRESLKSAQERFEQRVKNSGQRRVNARFEAPDLERLAFLGDHFQSSEADALRQAVRVAFESVQQKQRRSLARAGTVQDC